MELKFVCAKRYDAEEKSSNRTFMELKFLSDGLTTTIRAF